MPCYRRRHGPAYYSQHVLLPPDSEDWTCSVYFFFCRRLSNTESFRTFRTNSLVNKLMVVTVNNGALTSIVALTAFVANLVDSSSIVPIATCFLLGKGVLRLPVRPFLYFIEHANFDQRIPTPCYTGEHDDMVRSKRHLPARSVSTLAKLLCKSLACQWTRLIGG